MIDVFEQDRDVREQLHRRASTISVRRPASDVIVERAQRRRRRHAAQRAGAVGLVIVVVLGLGLVLRGGPSRVVVSPASGGTRAPLPAVPRVVVPAWTTTFFEATPTYTEYQLTNGDRRLQISFYGPDDYDGRVGGDTRSPIEVRGASGSLLDYGEGRFRADWREGGRTWEADGGPFPDRDAFLTVVASITVSEDVAAWEATLPAGTISSTARADAVTALLSDVPIPDGFDVAALQAGPPSMRYYLATDVLGAVACRWMDIWANQPGSPAAEQAKAALATTHQWHGLNDIAADGGYSSVLWQYADAMATGDPSSASSDDKSNLAQSYVSALGCR